MKTQKTEKLMYSLWTLFSLWLLLSCFFTMHLTVLSYLAVYFAIPLLAALCVGTARKQPEMRSAPDRIANILMCVLCGLAAVHAAWKMFVPDDQFSSWIHPRAALDAACLYLLPLTAVAIVKLVRKVAGTSQKLHKIRYAVDVVILGAMIVAVLAYMAWLIGAKVGVDLIVSCYAARSFLVTLFVVDTALRIAAEKTKA